MYPVKNPVVSQKYGAKSNRYKSGFHDGIDFKCSVGTPIYAARKGVITSNNWGSDYGIHVVQRRTFPLGSKNHLLYAHLSIKSVRTGQKVKKGQVIGFSGSTGKSTGPHLHFGEKDGSRWSTSKPVNPQKTLEA